MTETVSPSGVVGASGRFPLPPGAPLPSSALVLDGAPLPMIGKLRVYTCGITPYDVTHLGHASVFVWADLLRSVARLAGVEPVICRNVTDVDDVLTDAARRRGRDYDEFALTQEFLFDRDLTSLSVAAPDAVPHARTHIRHVVHLAAALLRSGHAYARDGFVFFRGADLPDRCGLDRDRALELSAAYGDQSDDGREDALDVPVWRPSPENHPAWPSPWGWGRPGWHAECAAMASTAFGPTVDVLLGGEDLLFPHHAYQAAMVEAATAVTPFARRQVHVGTVCHGGAKIAKSTGNLVLVRDVVESTSGPALRLLLLNRHWAERWEYDDQDAAGAAALLEELFGAAGRPSTGGVPEVLAALLEDLDVPRAVAVARDSGGEAARFLLDALKLTAPTP